MYMLVALLDNDTNSQFIFPIGPSDINFTNGAKMYSLDSIVLGEIKWGRGRLAEVIDIEGIFPGSAQNMPRHHYGDPSAIDKEFRDVLQHRPFSKELRLIINDSEKGIDINQLVYLEAYDSSYVYGDDTLRYAMTFVEARSFKVRRFNTEDGEKSTAQEKKRPDKSKPKTYTIKKGDTLSAISRQYTGTGNRWRELYSANSSNLKGGSPHRIYPGEVLTIPDGWVK